MPKKRSVKAEAKKAAAKAMKDALKEAHSAVAAALYENPEKLESRNHLASFAPFAVFNRNGLKVNITFSVPEDISEADLATEVRLTRNNMETMYVDGGWGWTDHEKHEELTHTGARHLIARDGSSNEIVGFAHYRFLVEAGVAVIYVWEIQLAPSAQRKGLGKHLMQLCELFGRKWGMSKIMLTVFKANKSAMTFYREKLGYAIDDISPSVCEPDEDCTYEILSKAFGAAAGGGAC